MIAAATPPWRYRLTADFTYRSPLLAGITFCNDWVRIEHGLITIQAGYAWDGCSPAVRLPVIGTWLGTPDGPTLADGWPQTGRASLVHDSLCQFRAEIPISKAASVAIFAELLQADGWRWWRLYTCAVNRFGPPAFAGDLSRR